MKTRLLSLLVAAFLAGALPAPAIGQDRTPPAPIEPPSRFDDFDDDYRPQYPRSQGTRDDEGHNLFWLWVIIGLSLLGGGGWYFSDFFDE